MVTPRKKIFTVKEGSTLANITCTCGDCEPKCISDWSSNGVTIGTDVLRLNSVSKSIIGNYTCTCTNPSTLKQARSEQRIEVEYGPDHARLTPENTSIVLQEGSDDFEVVCSCGECVPTCDQYWSFEGETIVQNQSVYFYKTFRTHAGEYRCTCSNPSTSKEETSHFFLSILFGPDNAFLAPTNRTITVHESSSMRNVTCICGDCEPKCEAQWLFNGNRSGYASLELNNVSRFDAGIYKCACMNPTTLKEANTDIEIVVEYGPDQVSLTPNKRNYQLQEGTVTLDILCSCGDCLPNCSQYWFFDGNKLAIVHNLHVNNVTRNHTGQYTCICVNPTTSREEESHFIVNVHYGPDLAFVNPYMTTFNKTVGSHLRNITCTCIDCEPKCTAAWRLNGTERSRNDVIYINRLSKSDAGRYTCICSNPSTLKTIESKHFDLIVNAIENTQPCPQNADEWGTMWETTYAGHLVSIDCKGEDYRGRISRLCSKTGEWLMPQYNCVRSTFVEVEKKLEILTINSSNDEVGDALDALVNLTNTNDEGDELYSGELKSVMRILGIIANLAAGGMPITEQQSKVFMNVVDNVLNKAGRRSWKSLSQTEESDGGSKLLLSVDVLSESLSNGLEDTNRSVITISLPNIVLETRKIDINQRKIKFPLPSMAKNLDTAMGTKLSLPLQNSTASNIRRYTVAVYKNLAGVLPNTVATRNDTENDRSQSLNTPVVSLHVFPYQQKLEKPLRLVLKHQQTHFRNPKCVYWSIQRNRWETDGCRVVTSTRSETTCECYHLTNLAVLMSPWSEPTVDSMAIGIISIVGCSISIICLIATATVHFLLWSNLNNDRAISLINICVALTVTYILFLAGIHQTGDKDGCIAVSVLLHYTTLVVFCLMLAEGIELTKTVFATKSGIKWIIPLAWGVPAAIVGLSMAITQLEGYGTQRFCWFSLKSGVIWAFVGPALFLIVANAVCLAVLLRTMLKIKANKDMSEGDRIKSSVRCLCVLVPLMGCTWLLGVFYVNERSAWMQYLFALCISLQGLFIFLFHGLLNKQLHNAIRRRHQKYTDSDSLTETQDTGQTEFQCTMNPVYSSDVPIQSPSKPNPILKYGRKLSVQLTKTGSYSPMQESDE